MVILASDTARGRVRSTAKTTTTATVESRKMVVILQIIGWQGHVAFVYHVLLWHWTFMLWSIDTCQNKLTSVTWPYRGFKSTTHRCQVFFLSWPLTKCWFFYWTRGRLTCWKQGRIVRKPVTAGPGLKFIRMTTYKTQIKILPFRRRVSLIRPSTARPRSYAFRLA